MKEARATCLLSDPLLQPLSVPGSVQLDLGADYASSSLLEGCPAAPLTAAAEVPA